MQYQSADGLDKHKEKGARLTAAEWNAVARAIGGDKVAGAGASDESSFALSPAVKQERKWILCRSEIDAIIEPYSALIFGVTGAGADSEVPFPQTPRARKYDITVHAPNSIRVQGSILTNGGTPYTQPGAGQSEAFYCHVVDHYNPTRLRHTDTVGLIPQQGDYCGLETGTGRVTALKTGLIAVSAPLDDDETQWYVASRGPIGVMGHTAGIGPANFGTGELGFGVIRPVNRFDGGGFTSTPDGASDMAIWNPFAKTFTNTNIVGVECPGIGLVVAGEVAWDAPGEVCETIGPFVTSVDWAACDVVTANIKLCINWSTRTYTFQKVAIP